MTEGAEQARLDAVLAKAVRGDDPPNLALMGLLVEASSARAAQDALVRAVALQRRRGSRKGAVRLGAIEALWRRHPDAWYVVRGTIDGIAHDRGGLAPEETLRYWAEAFDRLVDMFPEASVALYSLGSPRLLAAATEDVCARMEDWGLLAPHRDALDLGCGIGRFLSALAPRLRRIVGLDVSAGMTREARRRTAHLANVLVVQSSGRDLGVLADESVDLVLAIDVFPYLVHAAASLAEAQVAEMGRVLRPGGHGLILNYSYRGGFEADRRDVVVAADVAGLSLMRAGTGEFRLWDGTTFLLAKCEV